MLTAQLFNCQTPNLTPGGNPTFVEFKEDYLEGLFIKKKQGSPAGKAADCSFLPIVI